MHYEQMASGNNPQNHFASFSNDRTEPSKEALKKQNGHGNTMLRRYEDALFNAINTQSFYQRNGIVEPMIDSMNRWSVILIGT